MACGMANGNESFVEITRPVRLIPQSSRYLDNFFGKMYHTVHGKKFCGSTRTVISSAAGTEIFSSGCRNSAKLLKAWHGVHRVKWKIRLNFTVLQCLTSTRIQWRFLKVGNTGFPPFNAIINNLI